MDAMIDLETWGTRPGASLRSVGLATFELGRPSVRGAELYLNISREDCRARGLREEPGTVEWWGRQSPEARAALEKDPRSLANAVVVVEQFWRKNNCQRVWAQGANFDPGLWETACRVVGREAPWKFFRVMDTRTIYDAAGFDARSVARDGTHHSALDDARHQVRCVQEAFRLLHDPAHMAARARLLWVEGVGEVVSK